MLKIVHFFLYLQAYCLYRLNQLSEALAALNGVERSENVLQLEAQILYRKGEFGECISSYQKIFKEHKLNSTEIKTNIVAAYIARGRATEVSQLMESLKVSAHNGFEMAYNAACASIERKEFSKAEELLLLAHRYLSCCTCLLDTISFSVFQCILEVKSCRFLQIGKKYLPRSQNCPGIWCLARAASHVMNVVCGKQSSSTAALQCRQRGLAFMQHWRFLWGLERVPSFCHQQKQP